MCQLLHFSSENALHEGFLNHLYEHGFTALALCDEERNIATLTNLGHHEVHRAHSGIQTAWTITAAVAAPAVRALAFLCAPAADRPLPPSVLCTAIPACSASDPAASHIAVAILSDLWYSFCEPLGSLLYLMIFRQLSFYRSPDGLSIAYLLLRT